MLPILCDAFESQLAELNLQLADAREQLDALPEDSEEERVMLGRYRLESLKRIIGAVMSSRSQILTTESDALKRALSHVTWLNLVREIRRARERLAELGEAIKAANHAADVAEGARAGAQNRLTEYLNNPIAEPDFTPPAKIKKWNQDRAELENALQVAIAAKVEADRVGAALRAELFELDQKLHARPQGMEFQAEQLKPPPPPKFPGSQLGPGPRIQ